MTFKKLALASAIACVMPMVGHAVEALDDADLSGVTGQDGVEMNLDLNLTASIRIHDMDGLTGTAQAGYANAGAIVITGFGIVSNGAVGINIDAGDNLAAGNAPVLNIGVSIPTGTTITTGNISVANSGRDNAGSWSVNNQTSTIITSTTITLGTTSMNIQLGNEPQNDMIALSTIITGGINIAGMALNDANSGGAIGSVGNTSIFDTGSTTQLEADVGINATAGGLTVRIDQLGTLAGGMDIRIVDQYLGSAAAGIVGDVDVVGLQLAGTVLTISGK